MILAWSILVGLATYRLWRIPAQDSITEPFRDWLYAPNPSWAKDFLGQLVECVWCLGFWIAGGLAWLVAENADYGPLEFALVWLAGSTLAGAVRAILERLTR